MFKLESYIAPLLMGYVDKYVKLRPEDFQLSLWGGDIVLNKLDLRLDRIEHLLQLPITIKSGHIHELRIHVPWTKLGSEPVVVTINTIECILKLRNSTADESSATSRKSGTSSSSKQTGKVKPKSKPQDSEDLPPGYVQSIINRIMNNINLVINNLILKFVEDDIVFSLNVKSAEVYSVNSDWIRSFIELTPTELVLRRAIKFHDLTACLDKSNASGKIETYQDPLVYRCSLTCRLHTLYDGLHAKIPSSIRLDIMCDSLNFSLTDTQLPMFVHLIDMLIGIYYGNIGQKESKEEIKKHVESSDTESQADTTVVAQDSPEASQSWSSWAWSYVPPILSTGDEDEDGSSVDQESSANRRPAPPVIMFGMYFKKGTLTFKLTETVVESASYGYNPQKVIFKPLLCLEAEAASFHILLQGLLFLDFQVGITHATIMGLGECVCREQDESKENYFMNIGRPFTPQQPLTYLTGSLFDENSPENQGSRSEYLFDFEGHQERYNEVYGMQKFGAFWMCYLYAMEDKTAQMAVAEGSVSTKHSVDDIDTTKEWSSVKFVFGQSSCLVSSSMVHRLRKIIYSAYDHQYESYSKTRPEVVPDHVTPASDAVVQSLEEFIPTTSIHLTILTTQLVCLPAEHQYCDMSIKRVTTPRKARKARKSKPKENQLSLPVIKLFSNRFDFQVSYPMYTRRVVRVVSSLPAPSSNLLHHCHSHTYFKIFGFQACLSPCIASETRLTVIPPCNGVYYIKKLLLNMYWKDLHVPRWEKMYELPNITFTGSKAHLLLAVEILSSWKKSKPTHDYFFKTSLLDDIFTHTVPHPVMEMCLSGIELKQSSSSVSSAMNGTLGSVTATVLGKVENSDTAVPVLCGPTLHTDIHDPESFTHPNLDTATPRVTDLVSFTWQTQKDSKVLQAPSVLLFSLQGLSCCVDTALQDWLIYNPTTRGQASTVTVDHSLVHSAMPAMDPETMSMGSRSSSTRTLPSNTVSNSQSQSMSQSVSAVRKEVSTAEPADDCQKDTSSVVEEWFEMLRLMEIQVDMSSSYIYLPTQSLAMKETSADVTENIKTLFTTRQLPSTMVVCLPSAKLYSSNHKPRDPIQEIPIRTSQHSLSDTKFPWSAEFSAFSIYSIHADQCVYSMLKPSGLSSTVAISEKYATPISDQLSSLALCVHADMDTVHMACCKKQVELLAELTGHLLSLGNSLHKSIQHLTTSKDAQGTAREGGVSESVIREGVVSDIHTDSQLRSKRTSRDQNTISNSYSIPENAATGTMTDTSDITSSSVSGMRDHEGGVKLSLWLQWTLPKLITKVYGTDKDGTELCMSMTVDDYTCSVDVQDVYSKVTAKVGSLSVRHWKKNTDQWSPGPFEGLILTCDEHLTKRYEVLTTKLWTTSAQPVVNLFGLPKPKDQSHGFINFTLTRALSSNVRRRMRVTNSESPGGIDDERDADNPTMPTYINEICLNIQPCDVILFFPSIMSTLDIFSATIPLVQPPKQAPVSRATTSAIPVITSSVLPLAYVNMNGLRVFVPCGKGEVAPKTDVQQKEPSSGTLNHDLILLQLNTLSVSPQPDNPLPRLVVRKDLYNDAVIKSQIFHHGSDVEDKQYQLDIAGLAVVTGSWSEMVVQKPDGEVTSDDEASQNPAVVWNNLMRDKKRKVGRHFRLPVGNTIIREHNRHFYNYELHYIKYLPGKISLEFDVKCFPLLSMCDLRCVAAPAIVTHVNQQAILVCGHSIEVNITSDMDTYLSDKQIDLLTEVVAKNISAVLKSPKSTPKPKTIPTQTDSPKSTTPKPFVPFDILLTAGRISMTVYSHRRPDEDSHINLEALLQSRSDSPQPKKKGDLEHLLNDTYNESYTGENSLYFTPDNSLTMEMDTKEIVTVETVPLLYAYFSQPHTYVCCKAKEQKIEMSCYDLLMKGRNTAKPVRDDTKILPSLSEFNVHWLETRPGHPDVKTGIPPSLYTLKIYNFLQGTADVSIHLERPLKLNVTLLQVGQVEEFVNNVMRNTHHERINKESPSKTPKKSNTNILNPLSSIKHVSVSTVQVVVSLGTGGGDHTPGIKAGIKRFKQKITVKTQDRVVDLVSSAISVRSLQLSTCYHKHWCPLLGPMNISFEVTLRCCDHSGPVWMPAVELGVETSVIRVEFGQEHVLCGKRLGEYWEKYKKCRKIQYKTPHKQVKPHPPKSNKTKEGIPEPEQPTSPSHSSDDLRVGTFQYLFAQDEDNGLPAPGEIIFGHKKQDGVSYLVWTYADPRVLTKIHITPVPFNTKYFGEGVKVNCSLQSWCPVEKCFHGYRDFQLSEGRSCDVELPQVDAALAQQRISRTWRISLTSEDLDEESSSEPLVSPMTLAASMCVDSAFLPGLVPSVKARVQVAQLDFILLNNLQHLEKDCNPHLPPFYPDNTLCSDQEVLHLKCCKPTLQLTHWQHQEQTALQLSSEVSCDVLEYRSLTWQHLVKPCGVSAVVQAHTKQSSYEISTIADDFEALISQGTLHTLHGAANMWSRVFSQGSRPVFTSYIICNDSMVDVKIGQCDTDEELILQSREMHGYSWRTHTKSQLFHVSLKGRGWLWSPPFTLDTPGIYVYDVPGRGQKSQLIVRVKQINNVQKQVIISGQLSIASRLSQHCEVKVIETSLNQDHTYVLGAKQSLPSLVCDVSQIKCLRVRLMGVKTPWSAEISVSGEAVKEHSMIKLPVTGSSQSEFIHVWCSIIEQNVSGTIQTLVLFTPLFKLCTHLPQSVMLNVSTPRLKSSQQCTLQGKGKELELQCVGGDVTHLLTLQTSPGVPSSSPAMSLSAGMIDQVTKTTLGNSDIFDLCYNWDGCQEDTVTDEKEEERLSDSLPADLDLQVTLKQRWAGCNTLLLDISPRLLLHNLCNVDIILVSRDNKLYPIASGKHLVPPVLEDGFYIAISHGSEVYSSSLLQLSNEDTNDRAYLPQIEGILYKNGQTHAVVYRGNKVSYFTINSDTKNGMHILKVQEKYLFINKTKCELDLRLMETPFTEKKLNISPHQPTVSAITCSSNGKVLQPLTTWTSLSDNPEDGATMHRFVLIKMAGCPDEETSWCCPVELKIKEGGWRCTTSLPFLQDGSPSSLPLVISTHVREGCTYITVSKDSSPALLIQNNCSLRLHYGQLNGDTLTGAVESKSYLGTLPTIQPQSTCFYTFPDISEQFPEMNQNHENLRLVLAGIAQESDGNPVIWSQPFDVTSGREIFVSIPNTGDVKVSMTKEGLLTRLTINPVSRAEISAKEVRRRIKGGEETVSVEISPKKEDTPSTNKSFDNAISDNAISPQVSPKDKQNLTDKEKSPVKLELQNVGSTTNKNWMDNMSLELDALCQQACIVILDDNTYSVKSTEVLRVSTDNVFIGLYPTADQFSQQQTRYKLDICVGDLQIDNQMYVTGRYDFPVVLQRRDKRKKLNLNVLNDLLLVERLTYLKPNSLLVFSLSLCNTQFQGTSVETLAITFKPLCLYIEDTFIYDLLNIASTFWPDRELTASNNADDHEHIPSSVERMAKILSCPIKIKSVNIQPIEVQLSFHASLKLFLSSDNTPLKFGMFERTDLFTSHQRLAHALFMHYVSGALFRAGWVIGSLEIIGNPTGLVQNIGQGVTDLIRMPVEGFTQGPRAFVTGVTQGMSSLLKHITAGTLTSITNFASSMSRNMDRLSLDSDHCERQEQARRNHPQGLSQGLVNGLTGFGISLLGAVAGLAEQPIQGVANTVKEPTSPTLAAGRLVSGVGKGLMGVVTKPLGGAAGLVSQTGQGILQGVGLSTLPVQRSPVTHIKDSLHTNSSTKYMWKFLHGLPNTFLLAALPCTQTSPSSCADTPVVLLLTPEVLFIISLSEDTQQQAFAVSEIDVDSKKSDELGLWMNQHVAQEEKQEVSVKDRVTDFLATTSRYDTYVHSRTPSKGSLGDVMNDSCSDTSSQTCQHRFQTKQSEIQYFMQVFQNAKEACQGNGFIV